MCTVRTTLKTGYAQKNVNTSSSIWPTQATKRKLGVYAIEYTVESPNWTGKLHTKVSTWGDPVRISLSSLLGCCFLH